MPKTHWKRFAFTYFFCEMRCALQKGVSFAKFMGLKKIVENFAKFCIYIFTSFHENRWNFEQGSCLLKKIPFFVEFRAAKKK
jgi:hypothetical protein